MVGVMDGPCRQPQDLALELGKNRQIFCPQVFYRQIARQRGGCHVDWCHVDWCHVDWCHGDFPVHSSSTVSKPAGRMISSNSKCSKYSSTVCLILGGCS